MPVVGQREPEKIGAVLERWLAARLEVDRVEISDLVIPQSSGFSNETFLLKARWDDRRGAVPLVLRSQPQTHTLFPEIDLLQQQFLSMKLLGEHSNVPVPKVLWAESDTQVLGQPFFVMERLEGDVPGDHPPYTTAGFVFEMAPRVRRTWHENAVEAMTRVGRVDWRAAGFQHLDKRHHGRLGPEQRQGYFRHFLQWATNDEPHWVAQPAFERLLARWPDDGDHIDLCWGDARPGNQMFRGTEVIGVFDWEMVSLGNCESDLGWWLFLQRYSTDGVGAALPEGMLSAAETIARWESHMGRPAKHVDFYEQLAGFHFTLVMIRLAEMMGFAEMAVNNPVADIAARLLGIEPRKA
jgi:aminoglycoside phosphotransferase (APT) family kinase protein